MHMGQVWVHGGRFSVCGRWFDGGYLCWVESLSGLTESGGGGGGGGGGATCGGEAGWTASLFTSPRLSLGSVEDPRQHGVYGVELTQTVIIRFWIGFGLWGCGRSWW